MELQLTRIAIALSFGQPLLHLLILRQHIFLEDLASDLLFLYLYVGLPFTCLFLFVDFSVNIELHHVLHLFPLKFGNLLLGRLLHLIFRFCLLPLQRVLHRLFALQGLIGFRFNFVPLLPVEDIFDLPVESVHFFDVK